MSKQSRVRVASEMHGEQNPLVSQTRMMSSWLTRRFNSFIHPNREDINRQEITRARDCIFALSFFRALVNTQKQGTVDACM
mmetsp:Transcript_17166/g.34809  ORF Transcript_17166/g.34809 Transcript_17166/m.34809 type:complete len:81 (-) Transcript_17166:296-538(-)